MCHDSSETHLCLKKKYGCPRQDSHSKLKVHLNEKLKHFLLQCDRNSNNLTMVQEVFYFSLKHFFFKLKQVEMVVEANIFIFLLWEQIRWEYMKFHVFLWHTVLHNVMPDLRCCHVITEPHSCRYSCSFSTAVSQWTQQVLRTAIRAVQRLWITLCQSYIRSNVS